MSDQESQALWDELERLNQPHKFIAIPWDWERIERFWGICEQAQKDPVWQLTEDGWVWHGGEVHHTRWSCDQSGGGE